MESLDSCVARIGAKRVVMIVIVALPSGPPSGLQPPFVSFPTGRSSLMSRSPKEEAGRRVLGSRHLGALPGGIFKFRV